MENYLIFTDVSGDVDGAFASEHDVRFVPMQYAMNDETFVVRDMESEGRKEFYDRLRKGDFSVTSQITPFEYEKIFSPYLEAGTSIVCLCLSSGLSSTYDSACTAAKNLASKYAGAKFYPVDSVGATGSMGILLERSVANKEAGMSAEENVADIERVKQKNYTTCFVEDLMHLKRGGRIGTATAVFGTMLNIKPIIRMMSDGKLENFDKRKGVRKAVLKLAESYEELADKDSELPVYIMDADNDEMADYLEECVKKANPAARVRRTVLSPIIGTHLGPNAVVISFQSK